MQTFGASCGQTLFSIWGITCIIIIKTREEDLIIYRVSPWIPIPISCPHAPSQCSQQPANQSASLAASQPGSQPSTANWLGLFPRGCLTKCVCQGYMLARAWGSHGSLGSPGRLPWKVLWITWVFGGTSGSLGGSMCSLWGGHVETVLMYSGPF